MHSLKNTQSREVHLKNWLQESNHLDSNNKVVPLRWSNEGSRITDSGFYASFLAVPIKDTAGSTIGVLRFTEKNIQEELFSMQDEVVLERIACEFIGPRIESLVKAEMEKLVFENLGKVATLSIKSVQNKTFDVAKGVRMALETFIPEGRTPWADNPHNEPQKKAPKGYQYKYLINYINRHTRQVTRASIGGSMKCDDKRLDHPYSLDDLNSATKAALDHRRVILIHTPDKFENFKSLLPNAKSALIAPIIGDDGTPYGTLVVASERYDLDTATHGRFLEFLANQVSEIYTRSDALTALKTVNDMWHDVAGVLERIELLCESHLPDPPMKEAKSLVTFAGIAFKTHGMSDNGLRTMVARKGERFDAVLLDQIDKIRPSLKTELCRGELDVLDLQEVPKTMMAFIEPRTFQIILYNMIKNACYHESQSGHPDAKVQLQFELAKDGLLTIRSSNRYAKMSESEIACLNAELPKSPIQSDAGSSHGTGLNIIRRLAAAYVAEPITGKAQHRFATEKNMCGSVIEVLLPGCKKM